MTSQISNGSFRTSYSGEHIKQTLLLCMCTHHKSTSN